MDGNEDKSFWVSLYGTTTRKILISLNDEKGKKMKKILREKRLPRVKWMLNVYTNSIAVYIKSDEEEESSWKFFFSFFQLIIVALFQKHTIFIEDML